MQELVNNKLQWITKFQNDFKNEQNFLKTILESYDIKDLVGFLYPTKKYLNDPFLFVNMEKGIKRLKETLDKNGRIYLKIDCDVDGYTSSSLINNFIKTIKPEIKICYGYSFEKNHGLTFKELSNYTKDYFDLIIIPDASVNMRELLQIKNNFQADILILDHHKIEKEYFDKEKNEYINKDEINEKNKKDIEEQCYTDYTITINSTDGKYPNSTLTGVGVTYKFCCAYNDYYELNIDMDQWLDLVSTGQIADASDLRNLETRYLVLQGLKKENLKNEFLNELEKRSESEMCFGRTIMNVGWVIAPKINGICRYGKEQEQIDLFRAMIGEKEEVEYQPRRKSKNDPKPPVEIHSLQWNMARVAENVKSRQDTDVRNFMKKIETKIKDNKLLNNSVLFIDCNDIVDKKTVTGLVANKLATKYLRPVVLLRDKSSIEYGGSGRGYDKGNIKDFNEFLSKAGVHCMGHSNAFGVSVKKEDIPNIVSYCNKEIPVESLCTIHTVDWEIPANKLKREYVEEVANNYKIWGNSVPQPSFAITNLSINASQINGYGQNNTFIRFIYNGILFEKKYCSLDDFNNMTLVGRNTFGVNKKQLKLNIIGQFVLNSWEDKINPEVKILFFDSQEDNENTLSENINRPKKIIEYDDEDFIF